MGSVKNILIEQMESYGNNSNCVKFLIFLINKSAGDPNNLCYPYGVKNLDFILLSLVKLIRFQTLGIIFCRCIEMVHL